MPTPKPVAGTGTNALHPITPTYAAWLLTGTNPEVDSVAGASAPSNGSGNTVSTNPYGEPCREFSGAGEMYPISGIAAQSGDYSIVARIFCDAVSGFRTIKANGSQGFFIAGGPVQHYSTATSAGSVSIGTWVTVGYSKTGSDHKYYIDGVLNGTPGGAGNGPSIASIGIGGHAGERFDGKIDYILEWNRAITAAEHLSIHQDPFQVFGPDDNVPVVDAGPDQVATMAGTTLAGSATDADLDPLTYLWAMVSGPLGGAPVFVDDTDPLTDVSFTAPGVYVLELVVSDGISSGRDSVTITVPSEEPLSVEYIASALKCLPSAAAGTATTPPATDPGTGAWAVVTSSAAADYVLAGIDVLADTTVGGFYDAYCQIDVGVGAAAAEVVIATFPFIHIQPDQSHCQLLLPILIDNIPAGSRVTVRIRRYNESSPTTAWSISLLVYEKPITGSVYTTPQPLKVLPSTLDAGVGVVCPALFANGSWVTVSASLATDIVLVGYSLIAGGNSIYVEVDIGIGPAASEVVKTTIVAMNSSQTGSVLWVPLPNPLDVFPAGSRVAVRGRGSHGSSSSNAALKLAYMEKPL